MQEAADVQSMGVQMKKYNVIWKPDQNDEIDMGIYENIKRGNIRHCGFNGDGEAMFELTEQGKKECETILKRARS